MAIVSLSAASNRGDDVTSEADGDVLRVGCSWTASAAEVRTGMTDVRGGESRRGEGLVVVQPVQTANEALEHVTKHECKKLVYALCRELAFFYNLSLGLGGTSDSDRLRDELRQSRVRVCTLAKKNRATLIPLLKQKQTTDSPEQAERAELEKLYRVYSGCLEYLESQLRKVSRLQAIFPLHAGECLLINTGIVDPTLYKCSFFLHHTERSPPPRRHSLLLPVSPVCSRNEMEDIQTIRNELGDIQQLLYHVSSSVAMQPWDVAETDHKMRFDPDDEGETRKKRSIQRDFTRRRRTWVYVVFGVAVALLVIGIAVGVSVFMFLD